MVDHGGLSLLGVGVRYLGIPLPRQESDTAEKRLRDCLVGSANATG